MPQPNDLSRSPIALNQDSTLIAVIEMSRSSWLVAGIVPGIARHPLKKLAADAVALLGLLERWRAKTDRRDTALLKRVFLGWLRGEPDHCTMAAVPTLEEEDARRPNRKRESLVGERTRVVNRMKATLARLGIRGFKPTLRDAAERLDTLRTPEGAPLPPNTLAELRRDMARLGFIVGQIKEIEDARQEGLAAQPDQGPPAMVRLLARVIGIGIETADMLVHEILSRNLRDRRAVARYAGLTGSPDESGAKRREKGLAKAGNARVRRGMVQLASRFLLFQKDSALV